MRPLAEFRDRVGVAVVGGVVHGGITLVSKLVATRRLDPHDVARMRELYVPGEGALPRATAVARDRGAVVLCAEPGTGRRITAVSVAADLGLAPEWLNVEEEDVRAGMLCQGGKAYLLNLQESVLDVLPLVGRELPDYVTRLREVGSCLIVLATRQELGALDLTVTPEVVKVHAADSREVFLSHVRQWLSPGEAEAWAHDPRIGGVLASASPQDAVTLAEHVHESGHRTPELGADDVIAAYHHWETELTGWFSRTQGEKQGYQRAVKLAVAALEGAPVGAVFSAADELCEAVGVSFPPGRGLVGPGVKTLLDDVSAKCVDGRAAFGRPRYGAAVLDHVWEDRPNFRRHLVSWLRGLHEDHPAEILLRLAMDHDQPELVLDTVTSWSDKDPERAGGMLAAAAMSDELGRVVRGRMYQWAKAWSGEPLLLVVAAVCGGPLADTFDRIAFTRLKHLAGRGMPNVDTAVLNSLELLAERPRLRVPTVAEVVRWVESAGRAHRTGVRAFLHLTGLRSPGGDLLLMPGDPQDEALIDALATGWRAALRDQERAGDAKAAAVAWLEEVAQGRADPEVICRILARACRSSMDTGVLTALVWNWSRSVPDDGVDREALCVRLMRRIGDADRLTPGLPRLGTLDAEGSPVWDS